MGRPSAPAGGDAYHCMEERSRTRLASVPQKGRHAAEEAPEAQERAAQAAGAEVMKRVGRPGLVPFRRPQLQGSQRADGGRRVGEGGAGGVWNALI